ncbi:MAG: glycerophosphodiester phosphodiesterase family protein [Clostridia bacterium]|nr:glycerophosphodiester phosphodiesterase family protein [Clostridia bacterium]
MSFDLRADARERLLLVAHRGVWAGNIPCNTIAAYEAALRQGADMIEIDVDYTADGKLIVFHPGMEKVQLGFSERLTNCNWDFVKQLRYINMDNDPTQFGINTLEEVLEQFKGRCYINIDKFWLKPKEVTEMVRRHGMIDQILAKTASKPEYLDIVEEHCPDIPYMVVAGNEADIERAKARKINFVGTEVIFREDTSPLCSPEFIEAQHKEGNLLWCNAIVYNYRAVLAGGHSDDRAFLGDPEGSWGWIADRGFDLMQTDHVLESALFLDKTGRRKRTVC